MEAHPRTSIVVLVHETPTEAREALESVVRHTDGSYELVIVDNGSGPATRDQLSALAGEVNAVLLRLDKNLGFSAGSNAGWRAARGQEICLLNSDVVLTARWLPLLRAALHSAPDIGAVGPRSNFARAAQGGIWLEDLSARGIEQFARFFNHHDPTRWYEPDWLMGFALLMRRAALETIGGFDEAIPTFGGEDQDLCERLQTRGWRLICAGDTFVFHSGHRTFDRIGLNRTASRLRRDGAEASLQRGDGEGDRLVRAENGWVFEITDGVAAHVETALTLRLIQRQRRIEDVRFEQLKELPLGPPVELCRGAGGEVVWLLHRGTRRRVEGDLHRIRRLGGVTIAEEEELAALPEGPAVAVEEGMVPVPHIRPLQPADATRIEPDTLAPWESVAEEISGALDEGHGYGVIQLRAPDALALDDGIWSEAQVATEVARATRLSVIRADAVAIELVPEVTSLLEKAFYHLDLYPRLRFDAALLSGEQLGPLLRGRRVAIVSASGAPARASVFGAKVTLELPLDDAGMFDGCIGALSAGRDGYDAVLVAASPGGAAACARAARELGVVAIDVRDLPTESRQRPSRSSGGSARAKAEARVGQPVPMFIIAAEPSGAGVLRSMLELNPEVWTPAETHLVSAVLRLRTRAEDPKRETLAALLADPAWTTAGIEVRKAEARFLRRTEDSSEAALRVAASLLPQAHFIHVVRDGRDAVTAMRALAGGPSTVEEASRWWSSLVRAARQLGACANHYAEIRYEQLLEDPEGALQAMCHELGLEVDPKILVYGETAAERGSARASIGKWRSVLSPDEQRRFFEAAGDLLQELGDAVY